MVEGLRLPDLDDRHVVAAAIRAGAQVIVTANVKDFPAAALEPFNIEAQHPDVFIVGLIDLDLGPSSVGSPSGTHTAAARSRVKPGAPTWHHCGAG